MESVSKDGGPAGGQAAARLPARGLRVAVNTQTPLIRLQQDGWEEGERTRLDDLEEARDYKLTTGGVTRMLDPLLQRWLRDGTLAGAEWVSLSATPRAPVVEHGRLFLSFVPLGPRERPGYALVKERLWSMLNADPKVPREPEAPLPPGAMADFQAYQRRSALRLAASAARIGEPDLIYVHDFQQIGVGRAWEGREVPRVFHLHTPFPSVLPDPWRDYLLAQMSAYDAVVVSTHRYARNLRGAGFAKPIHVIPPFIDPAAYPEPDPAQIESFRQRFDLDHDDRVVLNVARMDPIKGQDRLIRAMPEILEGVPEARLVLVGNGSFSSSRRGGLGLSKGQRWRARLEDLAKELGVSDRVTFTGHVPNADVPAVYAACEVFGLPSTREGFGLAAIEAWRYRKPVVVCDRAGVSDLVQDGENGRVVDCGDPRSLAAAVVDLLRDPSAARDMGEHGFATSREATLPVGARRLSALFDALLEELPHVTA